MESNSNASSSRSDRKTIEKNRRIQMKTLQSDLNSLLPNSQNSREPLTQPDQLDEAAKYIKKLQVKVERMKERKRKLVGSEGSSDSPSGFAFRRPRIEIQEMGPIMNIVLVTGLDCKHMFYEIIRVLTDEGTDVSHSSFSVVDDAVFHTLQCKVEVEECDYEAARGRISERLKRLVDNVSN
ncbi:PREDICTED: uncharacterized protein LOC104812938 [Tarenaya hassleriana]|uniref:uncharacterized protein LOC104812938 n=1 Tax=Tarenaya hassleriana TaxID=28532 RepID=UPI00053C8C46|nr:PREDICTED: uncharacterized protein LOC104812938 [Tarenaya hassleriana]